MEERIKRGDNGKRQMSPSISTFFGLISHHRLNLRHWFDHSSHRLQKIDPKDTKRRREKRFATRALFYIG
jgi:hypothetical protein